MQLAVVLMLLTGAACRPTATTAVPPILLFNGTGTSPNDVAAIEAILNGRKLAYATANSAQLDQMSEGQLRAYQLLVVPGGNYLQIGDGLTAVTLSRVRSAVQGGVNYLGICAGGLLAGDVPKGFNLTSGVRFEFYSIVNQNIHKAPVMVSIVGGPALEHYWEDGPRFTGWGDIVGKYPDGTPAVVQGSSGKGCVILCGVHPEAPESWRSEFTFSTPTSASHEFAAKLIEAALGGKELPKF